jgi:ParB family chromosome partitioning protein
LIVSYDDQTASYTLVAGGRRLLAASQAGLQTVPAIVRHITEQQRLELALIENLQRADLNALESAEAYRQLVDEFGLSHEEVAARVGKSRVSVTNTLRLLKLPEPVKKALLENRISEGHARALLSLHTSEAQNTALHTILQRQLTVRQTEELVQKLLGQAPTVREKTPPSPETASIEDRLRSHLGTKVHLTRRKKGGTISIRFYSEEEFNSLIDKILGQEDQIH